jgi:predicted dehydrogenase
MDRVRMAVVGAGGFGRNHLRVIHEKVDAELVAVVDTDAGRAAEAAERYGCRQSTEISSLYGNVDAAIVAVPTTAHAETGCALLEAGIDVLVEKPIASDLVSAQRLIDTARANNRVLQVGHLERFNPAVQALRSIVTLPLFFEIHRLNVFSPRGLDVDVVLDLMIHDIDIILSLTGILPEEVRASGLSILSSKVDIANVRLAFPGGCIANLTASRVSTDRVRKLRLFQPHQYVSLDYERQNAVAFTVSGDQKIGFAPLPVKNQEPLKLEVDAFADCVRTRARPLVGGEEAAKALAVSLTILDKIEEHLKIVACTLEGLAATLARFSSS